MNSDSINLRRREIFRKLARQVRLFFVLVVLLILPAMVHADTITGTIRNTSGQAMQTNVLFNPLSTPLVISDDFVPSTVTNVQTAVNGTFSVALSQGDYKVTVGGATRDSVIISVPGDGGTHSLASVITSEITYTSPYIPAYELIQNKGAINGYASLNASGLIPPAQLGTGTADATTFLRGDGSWVVVSVDLSGMTNHVTATSNALRTDITANANALAGKLGPNNPAWSGGTNTGWLTIVTNAGTPVGGINLPDGQNIYFNGTRGSIFYNAAHPGGGEFQFTSQGSLSLNVGYDIIGGRTGQIGTTGGTHEYWNVQYDAAVDSLHPLGFSKLWRWASTAWTGSGAAFHYIASRAEARDQSGLNSELVIYNPSPSWSLGYNWSATLIGGVRIFAFQTNGIEVNGRIARQLETITPATSTHQIDFNSADNKVINLTRNTTFTLANLYLTNQAQRVSLSIYPGLSSWTIAFPTDANGVRWIWRNADGTATAPTLIAGSKAMFVELYATVNSSMTNIIASYTLGSYSPSADADAAAFFAAAGITDPTQKAAVNQLVLDLKADGLWSKIHALYPFVGGSPTAHSYNLKNPATFQITWSSGGVTHNANGITGDGSTGYGDTGYKPSVNGLQNSCNLYVYNKTATPTGSTATPHFMGCANSAGTSRQSLAIQGAVVRVHGLNNGDTGSGVGNFADFRGNMMVSRTSATAIDVYFNAGAAAGTTVATTTATPENIHLLARKFTGFAPDQLSNANIASAEIGEGFTSAEKSLFFTRMSTFQTTLGR